MSGIDTRTEYRIESAAARRGTNSDMASTASAKRLAASVLVCTRNRSASLLRTLESIDQVSFSEGQGWEVIVVDNGSTDDTEATVRKFADTARMPVRYLFEGRCGKSAALNTGVGHARGAIVAFTDDDCLPDKCWLEEIIVAFEKDPDLAVLGGRVELYDARDKNISVVRCDQWKEIPTEHIFQALFGSASDQETWGSVIGANMAVRRKAFAQIGLFDLFLAPGSMRTSVVAEDSDFVYRASRSGRKIAYSPAPLVYHNHGRRTDSELDAVFKSYARGRGAFYFKHSFAGDIRVAKKAYWELGGYCKALLFGRLDPTTRKNVWRILRDLSSGMATQIRVIGRNRTGGTVPFQS